MIQQLFEEKDKFLRIQGPMVRYSKLPFRLLCRKYNTDICYTPMIIASSFNVSKKARDSEFSTNKDDHPLVVQFAANNSTEFAKAALKVVNYSEAVGLNCGCPQKWAIKEGIGSALLENPQIIFDSIKETRNLTKDIFPVSIKIRLNKEIKKSIDLAQQIEKSGAKWLDVHGRTPDDGNDVKVNIEGIKTIKQVLKIPVVHNGDVFSLEDAENFYNLTKVDGIMSARGILSNPALFAGYKIPPLKCVDEYLKFAIELGQDNFKIMHHHILTILEHHLTKDENLNFREISCTNGIIDFIEENIKIKEKFL